MSKANSCDFDWRTASFFAASGMGGALIGAKFTHLVSAAMLLLLFGTLMLVVGTGMCDTESQRPLPMNADRCAVWRPVPLWVC